MAHGNSAIKHNIQKKKEDYKKNEKIKKMFDKIMFPVALIGPIMMIPQISKIYIEKDASSIAVISWILFLFSASLWMVYGIYHKEKVIVISNIAWLCAYIFVIIGVILY